MSQFGTPDSEPDGEIKVTATVGRRRITLDPLNKKALMIEAREVESTIPCGFQLNWGKGSFGSLKFDMACGAGLGSRWMTFTIKGRKEGSHDYCISADDIAKAVIAYHEELYPKGGKRK